jgi:ubiquitin carboxyl-terminal hydrolase 14
MDKNLIISMRDLFRLLKKSGEPIPPLVFTQTLRTAFPQFSQQNRGQFMQQDAEECFTSLVSCLDRSLPSSKTSGTFVSDFMTGQLESTYVYKAIGYTAVSSCILLDAYLILSRVLIT